MAKTKMIKAKVLVNLKYDKKCVSINDDLKIRVEDAADMAKRGYVEILEEIPEENEEGKGETPEEGEAPEEGE